MAHISLGNGEKSATSGFGWHHSLHHYLSEKIHNSYNCSLEGVCPTSLYIYFKRLKTADLRINNFEISSDVHPII